MRSLITCCAFAIALMATNAAHADLVMTIGNAIDTQTASDAPVGPFLAGNEVVIPVFAYATGATTANSELDGFSFAFDFSGPISGAGNGIPGPGFSEVITFDNFMGGNDIEIDSYIGDLLNLDYVITWSGGSVQVSSDDLLPTHLFNIKIATTTDAASGTYDLNSVTTGAAGSFFLAFNGSEGPIDDAAVVFDDGQFIINAVPEPGTLTMSGMVALGLVLRRRRR